MLPRSVVGVNYARLHDRTPPIADTARYDRLRDIQEIDHDA